MRENPPFEILYLDNHLIAVNKPAGVVTQSTQSAPDSLEKQVKAWIKSAFQKPGHVFLGVVHRLDRQVSGIVLFARTSKALARLNEAIQTKSVHKRYIATVDGYCEPEEGTLEDYLWHGAHQAHVVPPNHPEAKVARLHYKVLKRFANRTQLQVDLETGRYHQIRVQLASRGWPICGDKKYGSRITLPGGRIALHHAQLQLVHPVTQKKILIEAEMDKGQEHLAWPIEFKF